MPLIMLKPPSKVKTDRLLLFYCISNCFILHTKGAGHKSAGPVPNIFYRNFTHGVKLTGFDNKTLFKTGVRKDFTKFARIELTRSTLYGRLN